MGFPILAFTQLCTKGAWKNGASTATTKSLNSTTGVLYTVPAKVSRCTEGTGAVAVMLDRFQCRVHRTSRCRIFPGHKGKVLRSRDSPGLVFPVIIGNR